MRSFVWRGLVIETELTFKRPRRPLVVQDVVLYRLAFLKFARMHNIILDGIDIDYVQVELNNRILVLRGIIRAGWILAPLLRPINMEYECT